MWVLFVSLAMHRFVPSASFDNRRQPHLLARIQISEFKTGLDLFRFDTGLHPNVEEGLTALIRNPGTANWHGPYLKMKEIPADPWEHPYVYRCPGISDSYDILSYGRDGKEGGKGLDQDITYSQR
jgi:general secretion pathway protein G